MQYNAMSLDSVLHYSFRRAIVQDYIWALIRYSGMIMAYYMRRWTREKLSLPVEQPALSDTYTMFTKRHDCCLKYIAQNKRAQCGAQWRYKCEIWAASEFFNRIPGPLPLDVSIRHPPVKWQRYICHQMPFKWGSGPRTYPGVPVKSRPLLYLANSALSFQLLETPLGCIHDSFSHVLCVLGNSVYMHTIYYIYITTKSCLFHSRIF